MNDATRHVHWLSSISPRHASCGLPARLHDGNELRITNDRSRLTCPECASTTSQAWFSLTELRDRIPPDWPAS